MAFVKALARNIMVRKDKNKDVFNITLIPPLRLISFLRKSESLSERNDSS
jgi:hypothetical protein